ncbi:hypothetical protein SETIT_3G093100v2 [Setaria italica]|uniref:Helitron helicase-like domain-containing protein n=1 Tax=Setaria italica TaxID=4555 RepID=A0A368QDC6_SETIT|nr:hypothetical protein SETIT_3G093100v2 [Setaria italica]
MSSSSRVIDANEKRRKRDRERYAKMTDEEKQDKLKKQCEAYHRRKGRDATQYQKKYAKERQKYANMQSEQKKARIEQAITNREMRSSKTTKGSIAMENPAYIQQIFYSSSEEDETMSEEDNDIEMQKQPEIMNLNPKHLELYLYDDDPSLEHRYRHCREEKYEQDKHVVTILTQVLHENPYSKQFRSLGQNEKLDDYMLILNLDQRLDQRTYSIKSYYGCYDPLSYPLFFPRAELGWHSNIPRANTILEELRNDNFDRNHSDNDPDSSGKLPSIFNPILHGGRLFQQFAVDTYIKIESFRLDFIWHHQKEIRVDLYKGLLDSIQEGEQKEDKVGKRTVLASSFIGGPEINCDDI